MSGEEQSHAEQQPAEVRVRMDKDDNYESLRWQTYYQSNKDRLLMQKKNRYKNDPNYRDAIKAGRARQREREKVALQIRGPLPPRNEREGTQIQLAHPILGETMIYVYTMGKVAHRIRVTTQTLRNWEKRGYILRPFNASDGGHRLYTYDELRIISGAYEAARTASGRVNTAVMTSHCVPRMREIAQFKGAWPFRYSNNPSNQEPPKDMAMQTLSGDPLENNTPQDLDGVHTEIDALISEAEIDTLRSEGWICPQSEKTVTQPTESGNASTVIADLDMSKF